MDLSQFWHLERPISSDTLLSGIKSRLAPIMQSYLPIAASTSASSVENGPLETEHHPQPVSATRSLFSSVRRSLLKPSDSMSSPDSDHDQEHSQTDAPDHEALTSRLSFIKKTCQDALDTVSASECVLEDAKQRCTALEEKCSSLEWSRIALRSQYRRVKDDLREAEQNPEGREDDIKRMITEARCIYSDYTVASPQRRRARADLRRARASYRYISRKVQADADAVVESLKNVSDTNPRPSKKRKLSD